MSLFVSLALLTACSTPSEDAKPAVAEAHAKADPAHGKQIADEKCTSCHTDDVWKRADRKITSEAALEKQVDMCGGAAHLDDAEKADVTAYLESEAYSF